MFQGPVISRKEDYSRRAWISQIKQESLMSPCSVVLQDVVLLNNMVIEKICLGWKDAFNAEMLEAARLANVNKFVEKLSNK